jgi:hypothetical protein
MALDGVHMAEWLLWSPVVNVLAYIFPMAGSVSEKSIRQI